MCKYLYNNQIFFSPPPVKPEGTIGLHSVCQSVCLSVRHTSFRTITDSVIHLWSWNFIHLLPMSQGCALLILGSKGQGHGAWLFENGFRTITDSVINQWSWNFQAFYCSYFFLLFPTFPTFLFWSYFFLLFLQILLLFLLFHKKVKKKSLCLNQMKENWNIH